MLDYLTKRLIIDAKRNGESTRSISKRMGVNRETVSKYWSRTQKELHDLERMGVDERMIQEKLYATPRYKSRCGHRRKVTPELENRLLELINRENRKSSNLKDDT